MLAKERTQYAYRNQNYIFFDCKESVHADLNASHNIEEQGIQQLLDKTFTTKKKKKVALRKKQHSETNETPLTQKKDRV